MNGISNDHRLFNLRFLCPNCHSQTSTYCGKQLKGYTNIDHRCIDCNISIRRKSNRCKKCAAKRQSTKINWLDTPKLILMVKEMGYQEVGRRLGVSGNAIKKRIRNH